MDMYTTCSSQIKTIIVSSYLPCQAINIMFSVIVIIFEAVAILFLSIFARTNDTSSLSSTYFALAGDCFSLMFAFTLIYTPFRRLSISALALLLVIVAVTVQTNLLFDTFWTSCFNGFSSSFQVTISLIIRCLFASLAVLITALDFIGFFGYWQVYFIMAPIMGIGYSLIEAIIISGLNTFDGGGGMTVFLYSGVCSLMIWALCIRGKVNPNRYKIKESYINHTLGFIGVMIAFVNWPKFNMGGALATSYSLVNTSTVSLAYLQNSALANTFLGLSAGILASIIFASKDTKQDKLKFKCYIDCFINAGIVIASYQDIALNPSACIVMACFSTIATVVVHKYFITPSETDSESFFKNMMKNYSKIVFRIVFGVLGSIIASIVVASRNGTTPELLVNQYSKTAGLQIVAFIITILFGAVFGAITAVVINLFLSSKQKQRQVKEQDDIRAEQQVTDYNFFDGLNDQMHPLYYDIFEQINNKQEEKINIADYTTMVIKQALLGAQDNPLRMVTKPKPYETRVDPNKPTPSQDHESERQDEGPIIVNQPLTAQKSKLKIGQAESIPRDNKNVARKIDFDDPGSQIKQQKSPTPQVRY